MAADKEADFHQKIKWGTKVLDTSIKVRDSVDEDYESDYTAPVVVSTKRKRNAASAISEEFVQDDDDDLEPNVEVQTKSTTPKASRTKKPASQPAPAPTNEATTDVDPPTRPNSRKSGGGKAGTKNSHKSRKVTSDQGSRMTTRTKKHAPDAHED